MFGSQTIPLNRFAIILRHTQTFAVHMSKIELRQGEPLLGRQPIPLHRLARVLRNADARIVHAAEVVLRPSIASNGGRTPRLQRRGMVTALVGGQTTVVVLGIRGRGQQND